MGIRIRVLSVAILIVGALGIAPSLRAAATTPVQCAANDDRVWVYDSLTSFSVEMRLKCGEEVEIIGRAKGYVKVRTQSGKEGFVPEAAFPGLPAFVDPNEAPKDMGLAAVVRARTLAARAASAHPAASAATTVAPAPAAVAAVKPAEPSPTAVPNTPNETAPTVASHAAAPAPIAPAPRVVAATSTTNAAKVKPVSAAPKKTKSATPKASTQPPAESRSAAPATTAAQTRLTSNRSNSQRTSDRTSMQVVTLSSGSDSASPRVESAVETKPVASGADLRQPTAGAALRATADSADSEDYPEDQPDDQSADPSCRVYFSAYGLSPSQARWIEQVRRKRYPEICPAASPAKVDFVMLFTHDVDIYNTAMPDEVHVDKNGFSDFDPITPVDTAMMSQSAADKAHRQFVWVFQMRRGAFDPAKFSPRRRPQFTKSEVNSLTASHAADRSVEDAFDYIQGQGQGGTR